MFLHHGAFWNRGSEKVLLGLLGNLDKGRFEAVLVCNHELLAAEAENQGIRTYRIEWPEVMIDADYIKLQFIKVFKTVLSLRTLVRREKIDVLVCNSGLTTQAGYYAARLCGIPCVSYVHSPYTMRYIYLYRVHKSDRVIFVSDAIRSYMNKKVAFTDDRVIHNGIDIERYKPVVSRNRRIIDGLLIDESKVVIGQIGSLIHRKGIDILIDAGKKLAERGLEFHVVLVGSGAEEDRFREIVSSLRLGQYFTFYGNTDTPDIFYKHIFDINVLASRSEAFGLALAEGAACGLPCVGSNTEGIPEVMLDNETGLLFESGNADDLANKLELLIREPALRKEFGNNGRKYVVVHLSLSKQVDEFTDVILGLS